MLWDLSRTEAGTGYRLLAATVVPRPIAWVTTLGEGGVVNLAPYSFFNAMGGAPPVLALGLMRSATGGAKDTARNIEASGEFVVNLVPEASAEAMNASSAAMPYGVSEVGAAGLPVLPSALVGPPRLAQSPVAFECRVLQIVVTGPEQRLVVGSVLAVHVEDRFVLDAARGHVDTPALGLVARMHGAGWYARTSDLFEMDRPS